MRNKQMFRRRNYFIKKKFQMDFAVKFLAIVVIEAVLAIGLFIYMSRGTLTTGYLGSDLKVARTYDFFLPMLLFSNLIIVGITGIIGIIVLIVLSHRIAGPLYRVEKVLSELNRGDLTHRFKLRETDQFVELEAGINELANTMDSRVGDLKSRMNQISGLVSEAQRVMGSTPSSNKEFERLLLEISENVRQLEDKANYFKTS